MKKASPESIKSTKEEMKLWETEWNRLQSLRPLQVSWAQIKEKDLPGLERQVREEENLITDITSQVERVSNNPSPRHLFNMSESFSRPWKGLRRRRTLLRISQFSSNLRPTCSNYKKRSNEPTMTLQISKRILPQQDLPKQPMMSKWNWTASLQRCKQRAISRVVKS